MKTQIAPGACDSVFFPMPPIKAGKSERANGGSFNAPQVSLEPVVAGRISARRPARNYHSGLPASLGDWLVCKEALEICRRGCDGTKDGNHAWALAAQPVPHVKVPATASMRPQTAS